MYRLTDRERQERQERLAEVDQAVAIDRDCLVFELKDIEYHYAQATEMLKGRMKQLPFAVTLPSLPVLDEETGEYRETRAGDVAKTLTRIDPRDSSALFKWVCELADKMELAAQRLDMHDDPDKWREEIEYSYFREDKEYFTSWG